VDKFFGKTKLQGLVDDDLGREALDFSNQALAIRL
jgi:hypothetical protein